MSAELELAVEAEVVEPLDQAAASRIDQRIRLLVGTINDTIVKLREFVDKAETPCEVVRRGTPSSPAS